MSDVKATKITIEYEDGSIKEAVGEDAGKIMEHWVNCEVFWSIHGFEYKGPCLKEIKPKEEKKKKS